MIHAIRKLAREVHRRSVWQVLAVYLALGWVGLQGVRLATEQLGLPAWTPVMALTLLALGLPVTIATAVVQGGIPWLRIEDLVDPNELEGLTPEQVHVIPEAHPMYGVGVFTWRNAVLLGVMSLALLVTSVVAYFTMWALGIGPVGSLLAQGAITEDDLVLVATFENRTDVMGLGGALAEALEADLRQSTLVRVFDGAGRARALEALGGGPGAPVTPALARQLAASHDIAAVIEGDVVRAAGGYRVQVRLVLPPLTTVAQYREHVDAREELVPAVDRLSERVRSKLGESLRVIRNDPPLTEVVSPDLSP